MKTRNELAHDYFRDLLGNALNNHRSAEHLIEVAFTCADAFLAAAGEQGGKAVERKPDAAWKLELVESTGCRRLEFARGYGISVDHGIADPILAGRKKVRLLVYVDEVES